MSHVEKLRKCHDLIKKSTGVSNVIYKQQTGHTANIPKKLPNKPVVEPKIDIKLPTLHTNSKHLRLGNNKAVNSEV